eukprot:SAG31_NODE_38864_length_292_cov_2.357513_1_plen_56_part_10
MHQFANGASAGLKGRIRIPDPADEIYAKLLLARAYHIFLLGARAATSLQNERCKPS